MALSAPWVGLLRRADEAPPRDPADGAAKDCADSSKAPTNRLVSRRPSGRGDHRRNEEAVTPVLGTIMVLGITVVGIAGIMFWGAPAIARIQAQNAQLQMIGEFEDLRASTQELSVPDHSRFPTVVVSAGTIALEEGTRVLITANHDVAANNACDFRVTDWADSGVDKDKVTVTKIGCSPALDTTNLGVSQIFGSNPVAQTESISGSTVTVTGADFSDGDWWFTLSSSGVVRAQAWLISNDRISWDGEGSQDRHVYLDAGAIFSETDGTLFMQKPPAIGDTTFGGDYVGVWLRTLVASSYSSISGQGSHQAYLALTGNHLRIDEPAVYKVRYDMSGYLAEAWCKALELRDVEAPFRYVPPASCTPTAAAPVPSVEFDKSGASFEFRFLQAQIYASLIA